MQFPLPLQNINMTQEQKIDKILESQGQIQTQQAVMCNDIKHIIKDNFEFQNGVGVFKKDYYETKRTVEKHTIWFSIIHFFTAGVLGYLGFKTS